MKYRMINSLDALVIGSGAAGYNAANRILESGKKSVALLTEGVLCGTSRNTGSDKQTYYKLGLGGDSPDSVKQMARDLFSNGSADGDNALCEAALSSRCFLHLCELGVPFPVNRYGEYVGYKTDHDPYARATSAGPLTSKFMTEVLQRESERLGLTVYDGLLAIELLTDACGVCGVLALEKKSGEFWVFETPHVILATGGPAGIYADSVYPTSQSGSTALAIGAGASLQNMTEWQYGLASVSPRWNVSGTYMQVLPRFVSMDANGAEYEFLSEYFNDPYEALSNVFLKGYQWPFDSKKVLEGSSVIDLLIYRECVLRGRCVYLDFTKNPFGLDSIDFQKLSPEAYEYLKNADACLGTPIERLAHMNQPAIELYASKGVDISRTYLEIALCAQHNNGGIAVDLWWQTSVEGLFAVGECAGTHGVARPGGSALNAGQVGSLRAAQKICASDRQPIDSDTFERIADAALSRHATFADAIFKNENNVSLITEAAKRRMSDCGGAIRNVQKMRDALTEIRAELASFSKTVGVASASHLYLAYRLLDILTVQDATLSAMIDFTEQTPHSRGSALYTNEKGELRKGLEEIFRLRIGDTSLNASVQEIRRGTNGEYQAVWRPVRQIPDSNEAFESVWRGYRENGNII